MKKPGAPLNVVDLAKTVRSKLVLLRIFPSGYQGATPASVLQINTGRIYFEGDPEIDSSIVTGIVMHAGLNFTVPLPDQFLDFAQITYYGASNYIAYSDGPIMQNTGKHSNFFLSVADHQENYFWNQQACASLTWWNTGQGKFYKRLYNRVKLSKCYIESSVPITSLGDGNQIIYAIPFTFYYIPAPI